MRPVLKRLIYAGAISVGAMAVSAGGAFAQSATPSNTATATSSSSATASVTASSSPSATSSPSMTPTPQPSATTSQSPSPSATTPANPGPKTPVETPAPGGQRQPANAPFHATLTGAEQVPPIQTSDTGTFRATQAGLGLEFTLMAHGNGLTMAHIHSGVKGTNGPIIVTLYMASDPAGVSDINISGAITPPMLQGAYTGKFTQFMQDLEAGKFYVNVHSVDHPDGVVRGQVAYTAPVPPNAPNTGSGATMTDGGSSTGMWFLLGGAAVLLAIGASGGWFATRRSRS